MHYHLITDDTGDVVDLIPFCSDACHQEYCRDHGVPYGGWNGCHEGGDSCEFCANCGVFAGGTAECECQVRSFVVNRFPSSTGEVCKHGHWLQLPIAHVREFLVKSVSEK